MFLPQFNDEKERGIALLSLILMILVAIFSVGFHHPDEQYYAIDFAAFKVGLLENLNSWEYETELRPWALPMLFTPILFIGKFLGLSPFSISLLLRLFSGSLSLYACLFFGGHVRDFFKNKNIYKTFLFFLHFSFFMKFFSVRTNSENWGLSLFLIGLVFFLKETKDRKTLVCGSLFLGLSFLMRHQMGFMVFGLGLFLIFIRKMHIKDWILLFVFPMLLIFCAEFMIDSWGYGHLSFSPYNYIYQNIVLNKIKQFGTHPIYSYFYWSLKKTGTLGLLMIVGFLFYLKERRKDILLWSTFPFLVVHHLIGHKELRFLFPITPILLLMGFVLWDEKGFGDKLFFRYLLRATVSINLLLLAFVTIKPAYTPLVFYKEIYERKISNLKYYSSRGIPSPRLEMDFYKRPNLKTSKIDGHLESAKGFIWTTRYNELEILQKRGDCELLFSTYPLWILSINIGNWRSRSNVWALNNCSP